MKSLLLLLPIAICSAQNVASPGSLYMSSGRLADSARDLRANQVDDIVTIVVSESLSAVAFGVTNTSRKSAATSNITALASTTVVPARIAAPLVSRL